MNILKLCVTFSCGMSQPVVAATEKKSSVSNVIRWQMHMPHWQTQFDGRSTFGELKFGQWVDGCSYLLFCCMGTCDFETPKMHRKAKTTGGF